jgi:hypothetical protein
MPPRRVLRVEVSTLIGSAVAGGALLPFGGTPGRMSLFLLGWAGGCGAHLLLYSAQQWTRRRRRR